MNGMSEKSETQWYSLSKNLAHWETVTNIADPIFLGFTLKDFSIVTFSSLI